MKSFGSPRRLSALLALLIFINNGVLAHAFETNVWKERRAKMELASLPGGGAAFNPVSPVPAPVELPTRVAKRRTQKWLGNMKNAPAPELDNILTALSGIHGSIRKVARPNRRYSGRIVVHIQDIHQNQEAQKNIGATVSRLVETGGAGLVALEGASEPINLTAFHEFPDQKTVRKAADFLLKENRISGPIHAMMTAPAPPVIGIDDPRHYAANVEAVKAAYPLREKRKAEIKRRQERLAREMENAFHPVLRDFDSKVAAYRRDETGMGDYVEALAAYEEDLPLSVAAFLEAFRMEKSLNSAQVEQERALLLNDLVKKLTDEQRTSLTNASAAFRTGQINHADFYDTLNMLCRESGLSLNQYPAMADYLRYVLLSESIDGEKLVSELSRLEKSIYDRLAETGDEKRLVREARRLYLTEKLVDFALTSEEWEEYESMTHEACCMKDGPHATCAMLHAENLSPFERFYEEAQLRDEKMAENLIKTVPSAQCLVPSKDNGDGFSPGTRHQAQGTVVLVTGGFHSAGIEQRLIDAGYTVVTWTPKISSIESRGTEYLSVFTQEKTPLDRLFEGQKLFLAAHPISRSNFGRGLVLCAAEAYRIGSVGLADLESFLARWMGWAKMKFRRKRPAEIQVGTETRIYTVAFDGPSDFKGVTGESSGRHGSVWSYFQIFSLWLRNPRNSSKFSSTSSPIIPATLLSLGKSEQATGRFENSNPKNFNFGRLIIGVIWISLNVTSSTLDIGLEGLSPSAWAVFVVMAVTLEPVSMIIRMIRAEDRPSARTAVTMPWDFWSMWRGKDPSERQGIAFRQPFRGMAKVNELFHTVRSAEEGVPVIIGVEQDPGKGGGGAVIHLGYLDHEPFRSLLIALKNGVNFFDASFSQLLMHTQFLLKSFLGLYPGLGGDLGPNGSTFSSSEINLTKPIAMAFLETLLLATIFAPLRYLIPVPLSIYWGPVDIAASHRGQPVVDAVTESWWFVPGMGITLFLQLLMSNLEWTGPPASLVHISILIVCALISLQLLSALGHRLSLAFAAFHPKEAFEFVNDRKPMSRDEYDDRITGFFKTLAFRTALAQSLAFIGFMYLGFDAASSALAAMAAAWTLNMILHVWNNVLFFFVPWAVKRGWVNVGAASKPSKKSFVNGQANFLESFNLQQGRLLRRAYIEGVPDKTVAEELNLDIEKYRRRLAYAYKRFCDFVNNPPTKRRSFPRQTSAVKRNPRTPYFGLYRANVEGVKNRAGLIDELPEDLSFSARAIFLESKPIKHVMEANQKLITSALGDLEKAIKGLQIIENTNALIDDNPDLLKNIIPPHADILNRRCIKKQSLQQISDELKIEPYRVRIRLLRARSALNSLKSMPMIYSEFVMPDEVWAALDPKVQDIITRRFADGDRLKDIVADFKFSSRSGSALTHWIKARASDIGQIARDKQASAPHDHLEPPAGLMSWLPFAGWHKDVAKSKLPAM